MIQADFILCATVGDKKHFFEYECKSIFQALEEFWHEDYPEMMRHLGDYFPIDSYYLCGSGVEKERHLMFNTAVFHAFFDHGHKADGPYTEEDFLKDIERTVKPKPNDVTRFMFYMWNRWCEEECKEVFGKDDFYPHFWNKWCGICKMLGTAHGAAEMFYAELSDRNRDKLVRRAVEYYENGKEYRREALEVV